MNTKHLRNLTVHCLPYCGWSPTEVSDVGDSIIEIANLDWEEIEALKPNSCPQCVQQLAGEYNFSLDEQEKAF